MNYSVTFAIVNETLRHALTRRLYFLEKIVNYWVHGQGYHPLNELTGGNLRYFDRVQKCLASKRCSLSGINCRCLNPGHGAGYTKNFEIKWIVEVLTKSKCERPNHPFCLF